MRLVWPLVIVALVLVLSVVLDAPPPRADLNLPYLSVETLDPQMMRASEDVRLAFALFEGLCSFEPQQFRIVPGVAESWEISDDQLTYTFHLRREARWSSGDPVTAGDFAFAWRLGLMPDTAPPYIDFLMFIDGGRAYFEWCVASLEQVQAVEGREARLAAARRRVEQAERKFDELVGVEVVDRQTLRVTLERRVPFFLELAATWPLFPLHRPTIEAYTRIDPGTLMLRRDPEWARPGAMVSNGPFHLDRWRFKRDIRLAANPHYWNAEAVGVETMALHNFKDLNTAFVAYETGALDVMIGCEALSFMPDLIEQQVGDERRDVHDFSAFATYYYVFNTRPTLADGRKNPFADARVRRAFAMVVDKRPIVEEVTRLRQEITNRFIPAGSIAGYASPEGLGSLSDAATDAEREAMIEQARGLLAEAGYPDGDGLDGLLLIYNTNAGHEAVAQAVRHMWSEHLGVKVGLEAQEWKVFLRRRNAGEFHIARSGWFGDYSDPTTFLDLFKTGNGNNDAGFSDPHYDGLLEQAAAERDLETRMAILSEAERYVMAEKLPALPLYHYKIAHLYDPQRIAGPSEHPRNLQMYGTFRVKN